MPKNCDSHSLLKKYSVPRIDYFDTINKLIGDFLGNKEEVEEAIKGRKGVTFANSREQKLAIVTL